MIEKTYSPEPTILKFHHDDSFVRGVRGPIGSGKSVGCCQEILARASRQTPNATGRRRSRWAIVRNTYGELRSTTIKTWQDWVPDEVCPIIYDAPIRGTLVTKLADNTILELELLFIALDRPDHVRKLLSLELTAAWVNEAREVPKTIIDALTGRVGRFPSKSDGGFNWSGVIMDTNPPDDDHWWYKLAEEGTPVGWKFYTQPPALLYDKDRKIWMENPLAENVRNHTLGIQYWLRQVAGKTMEWIKVYILGQYGNVKEGKPVFPEYNDDLHCAKVPIKALNTIPLLIGFDFGLTPSAVFGQVTPRGRLNVINEATSHDMGISQFMRDVIIPMLSQKYEGIQIVCVGDPAGNDRAQTDERTCFDIIRGYGLNIMAASSNNLLPRREAVAGFLNGMDLGSPQFQLSPDCKMLRRGFLGGYRYQRVQVTGEDRFKDIPEKNQYSHPHDGLQYLSLLARGGFSNLPNPENEAAIQEIMASMPIVGSM